ncbi:hypothetical protein [Ruminococcus sp. NK3A76]|uniref:hypothetical protein n=1 Tax=Ruminococcus sp. NK3A76 TaxID=877411 RepID=UPI00048DCA00|nr:hypothetical protein [Ruminococcus sp. NK3A76]
MDDYAPIFIALDKSLKIIFAASAVLLLILIVIVIRIVKLSKAKKTDDKPSKPAIRAAAIACYVIIALLITSPFWIGLTPIMDWLKEIV